MFIAVIIADITVIFFIKMTLIVNCWVRFRKDKRFFNEDLWQIRQEVIRKISRRTASSYRISFGDKKKWLHLKNLNILGNCLEEFVYLKGKNKNNEKSENYFHE